MRWGKPTKNKKRRDPRYFLNENAEENSQQRIEEVVLAGVFSAALALAFEEAVRVITKKARKRRENIEAFVPLATSSYIEEFKSINKKEPTDAELVVAGEEIRGRARELARQAKKGVVTPEEIEQKTKDIYDMVETAKETAPQMTRGRLA